MSAQVATHVGTSAGLARWRAGGLAHSLVDEIERLDGVCVGAGVVVGVDAGFRRRLRVCGVVIS